MWYNERQLGLGKKFVANVRKTIQYISQNPKAVALRYDINRCALLNTFPYMIHFSIDESKKRILVTAVLSTSRDPKLWEDKP